MREEKNRYRYSFFVDGSCFILRWVTVSRAFLRLLPVGTFVVVSVFIWWGGMINILGYGLGQDIIFSVYLDMGHLLRFYFSSNRIWLCLEIVTRWVMDKIWLLLRDNETLHPITFLLFICDLFNWIHSNSIVKILYYIFYIPVKSIRLFYYTRYSQNHYINSANLKHYTSITPHVWMHAPV